ncbi:MAG: B12-binding domain-containing radical SAM protein, partial [Clostridia bacterium]
GIHPTSVPEKVIKNEFVDFIITGEGEGALADLVQKLENQDSDFRINNLWSKKDGQVIANEPRGLIQDLDSLPFPDKNLYSGEFTDFHKQYSIITSRGCPFSCTYCSNSYLKEFYRGKGEFLRFRSVENVIKELKLAKERYKMGSVLFFDEELFSDSNRAKRLLSLYKKEIGLPFWCYINPQIMDEEKIALLEESGCNSVEMGVQDTDADINKNILKRKIDLGHLKKVIRGLRKAKISIFNDIILGLPTQKEHNLIETVSFFNENRIDHPMLYWLRYYPRTEIVGIAMKEGALSPDKYEMLEGASCSFFIGGSTYNPRIARIANLFYLCCILPGWLMSLIIRKKAYRYFPPLSLRFYLDEVIAVKRYFLQLLGLKKKRIYFAGKTPVYLHYFFKWLTIR